MKALSVGFPGREKSSRTPFSQAHRSNSLLMNSGPLSTRMVLGVPWALVTRSSVSTTSEPAIAPAHVDRRRQPAEGINDRQDARGARRLRRPVPDRALGNAADDRLVGLLRAPQPGGVRQRGQHLSISRYLFIRLARPCDGGLRQEWQNGVIDTCNIAAHQKARRWPDGRMEWLKGNWTASGFQRIPRFDKPGRDK